jgi:ribosome-binding factor A
MRKSKGRAGTPSQRQYRVGEELRHVIAHILDRANFRDPDLDGVPITVTEVRVSPDLQAASAYVTPLGGREIEKVVKALNRASGYFRREIAREVALRRVPGIIFVADTSFDYSSRVEDLLARPEVARDIADTDAADPDSNPDSDTGTPAEG